MGFTEQIVFIFGKDEAHRDFIASSLANNNFQVKQFGDFGELCLACSNEAPFALVFCENLFAAGHALKKLKQNLSIHLNRMPLMIIVDENNSLESQVIATEIGIDFFIGAPFNVQQLIQFLRQQENLALEFTPRVLIVDDESSALISCQQTLSLSGIETRVVQDFDAISAAFDTFQPDLVLVDFNCSVLAPLTLYRVIKQSAAWQHVAFVILADCLDAEIQNSVTRHGIDGLLTRPVDASQLVTVIQQKTRLSRMSAHARSYLSYSLRELEFHHIALNEHAITSSTDVSGRILTANKKFCEISGYQKSELLGRNHRLLKSDYHTHDFYKTMWETIHSGRVWHGKICNKKKNGHLYWVESTIVPFLDKQNKPYKYVSVRTDITELCLSESRLNRSQIYANIGTWDWDIRSGELFWSNCIAALFGYDQKLTETTYENFIQRVHPADRDSVEQAISACVNGKNKYFVEHRVLWPDGTLRWMRESGDVERSEEGEALRMLGVVQDITEQKNTQRALQNETQRLLEAQQISNVGDWVLYKEQNKLTCSMQVMKILGLNQQEELGLEQVFSCIHSDDVGQLMNVLQKTYETGYSADDCRIVLPDGRLRWVHCERYHFTDEKGLSLGLRGTIQDISQRKSFEEALSNAKEQSEKANRAKSVFLSSMSHELRTPLNAIFGFSQLLQMNLSKSLTEQDLDNINEIIKAGNHLLELINEVLDLAKIESGHVSFCFEDMSVHELLHEAIDLMMPLAKQKNVRLMWRTPVDDAVKESAWNNTIRTDRMRLKQVLLNLLSNAVKYNRPGGKVIVSCEILNHKTLCISIEDQGQGMSAEQLAHLFEPYNRLGAERSTVHGVGIGLVISKNIIELMGGNIHVQSRLGAGSTFQIHLPLDKALGLNDLQDGLNQQTGLADKEDDTDLSIHKTCSLLYIEDNPVNLKLFAQMFASYDNIKLHSASSPETGLELAKRERPNMIVLDINMPGMSGFDVLAALKSNKETASIPVIALSASAMKNDIEKGLEAGFSYYITKPIRVKELLDIVDAVISQS